MLLASAGLISSARSLGAPSAVFDHAGNCVFAQVTHAFHLAGVTDDRGEVVERLPGFPSARRLAEWMRTIAPAMSYLSAYRMAHAVVRANDCWDFAAAWLAADRAVQRLVSAVNARPKPRPAPSWAALAAAALVAMQLVARPAAQLQPA